jgi:hypothetical protein
VPDMKLAAPTLDAVVLTPSVTDEQRSHLCLDKGYDYDLSRYASGSLASKTVR